MSYRLGGSDEPTTVGDFVAPKPPSKAKKNLKKPGFYRRKTALML